MLKEEVIAASRLTNIEHDEILHLCSAAYEEDMAPYFALFEGAVHVLGRVDDRLVSHALWVTRWLQIGDGPLLRTAYIEAVATDESYRRRGYAAQIMRRVASEIQDFELAGLAPFSEAYYARLGWETWRGPLLIRQNGQVIPTPSGEDGDEECLMIYRLPQTPKLDLSRPISIEWRAIEVW